jgi:hypothetical protein
MGEGHLAWKMFLALARRVNMHDATTSQSESNRMKMFVPILGRCYLNSMQDILNSLTIGATVHVKFFSNSGERDTANGVKKELFGVVVKLPTFASTTGQTVCTLDTAKGPRSFPCHTVSVLKVNGETIR